MTILTFRGYGVQACEVTIVLERVTHWESINYNGVSGVRLYLDTGKEVSIDGYTFEFEKRYSAAMAARAST